MSNTRATIRANIQALIDPATTEYSSDQLNRWINEAIQAYSNNIPAHYRASSTVTGTSITISRRIVDLDYLIIAGSEWKQLHPSAASFSGGEFFYLRPSGNSTTIILGTSQSSAAYTIAYSAPIDILTGDGATIIPDAHLNVIYHHVIASAIRHQLAETHEAATDTDLMTYLKTAVNAAYGRYYQALALAEAHSEQGIVIL